MKLLIYSIAGILMLFTFASGQEDNPTGKFPLFNLNFFKEQVKRLSYTIPSRVTRMDIRKRFRHCSTCHQTNFVCFSIVDLSSECICHHLCIYQLDYWTAIFGFYRKFDVQKQCKNTKKNPSIFKHTRIGKEIQGKNQGK